SVRLVALTAEVSATGPPVTETTPASCAPVASNQFPAPENVIVPVFVKPPAPTLRPPAVVTPPAPIVMEAAPVVSRRPDVPSENVLRLSEPPLTVTFAAVRLLPAVTAPPVIVTFPNAGGPCH